MILPHGMKVHYEARQILKEVIESLIFYGSLNIWSPLAVYFYLM